MKNLKAFCFGINLLLLSFSCTTDQKDQAQDHQDNQTENTEESVENNTEAQEEIKEVQEVEEKESVEEASPTAAVAHYICYNEDDNPKLQIWISFAEDGKAIQVKYKGQEEGMNLVFDKEEFEKGGANPNIIQYYNEIYEGKQNGVYKLTHSGIWDYAEYTRAKDQKKFNFTIDHDKNPYGSVACF